MAEIWFNRPTPESLNRIHEDTACAALGIRITEVGDAHIRGTMPVDARTVQPYGLLHGGASLLLAETLGSCAAVAVVDPDEFISVGTSITANHVRAARSGVVTGIASPLHLGRSSQLWQIDVVDEAGKSICLARLTTTIISINKGSNGGGTETR